MRHACPQGRGSLFRPKLLISDDLTAELILPEKLFFAGRHLAGHPSRKYPAVKVRSFLDFNARAPRLR
jgi:hypothetical protein